MGDNPFRNLPAVNEVLEDDRMVGMLQSHPRFWLVQTIRTEISHLREQLKNGLSGDRQTLIDQLVSRVSERIGKEFRPKLRRVINATGIVLHTNLGRAPMAEEAARAVYQAARGYLNLEMDLETGKRSSRQLAIREWACQVTGAESATVVNNNAGATVIVLRAVALDKEVILSRGQLIEIGGSFRIPEIMSVSGAVLREVGTTNITRLSDYEKAIGPETAALMQIHTSNFRIRGFTKSATLDELVGLGKKHNLPVIDDVGSGALFDFARFGLTGEPVVQESVAAGADLVLFSGDKLLGGPQAGIIVGKKHWIQKIEKDPLMRAFRLDKMTLAALESTLRIYLEEQRALRCVPTLRMLSYPLDELKQRTDRMAETLAKEPHLSSVQVVDDVAYVGGGSLPDQALPTKVLELQLPSESVSEWAHHLRMGDPAVVARIRENKLVLDLRTVFPEQEDELVVSLGKGLEKIFPSARNNE